MLWLAEELAQLEAELCAWKRRTEGTCHVEDLDRSAFVAWAWIDWQR